MTSIPRPTSPNAASAVLTTATCSSSTLRQSARYRQPSPSNRPIRHQLVPGALISSNGEKVLDVSVGEFKGLAIKRFRRASDSTRGRVEAVEFAVLRIVSRVPSERAAHPEAGLPSLLQFQQLDVLVSNFVTVILKSQIARASEVFYRSRLTV